MGKAGDKFRTALAAHFYEPVFWKLKKMPVLDRYREFKARQFDTPEVYERRLNGRLAALLCHARKHIPFFRENLPETLSESEIMDDPSAALELFPIMEKADVVKEPTRFVCEMNRGTFINFSGGSTGAPVKVYQDRIYQAATLGATYLTYEWAGKELGEPHLKLWGAQRDITHGSSGWKLSLQNFLANRRILNCFKLSPDDMISVAKIMDRFQPKLLEGYADVLYEVADYFRRNGIRLRHRPRAVISSAGTLLGHMRETIQEVFGAAVFDRYGSREAGNMASECERHQGLHIMGETTYLEIVGSDGRRLAPGEEGEILVTNLHNYTMPLIRYRIGDLGIMRADNCPCSRPYPMLKAVTGRSSACFRLADGTVISPNFFIHFIGVVHNDGDIARFQIVQKAYDHIVVRLVPAAGFDLGRWAMREALAKDIQKVMGPRCAVEFEVVADIPKTPTGKHLYTVCEMTDTASL